MSEQQLVYFNDYMKLRRVHPELYYNPLTQRKMHLSYMTNKRGLFNSYQVRDFNNEHQKQNRV